MKISVVGDGGWGSALAVLISRNGFNVKLWGAFSEYVEEVKQSRINYKFLPGIKLPKNIELSSDLKYVLSGTEYVILAVPSYYMRRVLKKIKKFEGFRKLTFLSVSKGIEYSSKKFMSEVIAEELGNVKLAVLSGPNIAAEVARGIPSAAVCASRIKKTAKSFQDVLMSKSFRVYTNDDLIGVEMAGALKNIIAIACGISDGIGYGTNTKAALLTRGLAEITRFAVSLGAKAKTFSGLAGCGDLVTTAFSSKSRNRSLGEKLGKGQSLKTILDGMEMVAEGVITAKAVIKMAEKHNMEMPITNEVCNVLFKNRNPYDAVEALMLRAKKREK